MPIIVTLDKMLRKRKMTAKALAKQVGLSETQLSMLRSGKVRGIRFSTLARICAILECSPRDLLDYEYNENDLIIPSDDGIS